MGVRKDLGVGPASDYLALRGPRRSGNFMSARAQRAGRGVRVRAAVAIQLSGSSKWPRIYFRKPSAAPVVCGVFFAVVCVCRRDLLRTCAGPRLMVTGAGNTLSRRCTARLRLAEPLATVTLADRWIGLESHD
ncbi:hypothetical protein QE152_g38031 [Popillia japonica]|uniref:Uncharacterized protein n=1 Tax=Popillia japonica TaxID=7064 RepID=A0AAW1I897_POPJA